MDAQSDDSTASSHNPHMIKNILATLTNNVQMGKQTYYLDKYSENADWIW